MVCICIFANPMKSFTDGGRERGRERREREGGIEREGERKREKGREGT